MKCIWIYPDDYEKTMSKLIPLEAIARIDSADIVEKEFIKVSVYDECYDYVINFCKDNAWCFAIIGTPSISYDLKFLLEELKVKVADSLSQFPIENCIVLFQGYYLIACAPMQDNTVIKYLYSTKPFGVSRLVNVLNSLKS